MWPEGLIASKASGVKDSLINNVRPADSLDSRREHDAPTTVFEVVFLPGMALLGFWGGFHDWDCSVCSGFVHYG